MRDLVVKLKDGWKRGIWGLYIVMCSGMNLVVAQARFRGSASDDSARTTSSLVETNTWDDASQN